MEGLAHVALILLLEELPWGHLRNSKKILQAKIDLNAHSLLKGFHPVFSNYVNYARNLQPDDKIDYDFYIK